MSRIASSSALPLAIEALLLCLVVLVPVILALRGPVTSRSSREPALALHRAQRAELERDHAVGLIAASEHQGARLEIDRRLLAASSVEERASVGSGAPVRPLWIGLLLVPIPLVALLLYGVGGHPLLGAQPLATRMAQADGKLRQDEQLIGSLRDGLAKLDPADPQARQGYLLLGQAEASHGNWGAAAAAWRVALDHGFDPTVALQVAEAQTRADGKVSPQSAALFRRALDQGSQDAPWRQLAEQRIAQSEHQ
jgi:cytochrome c-type biogenesis protein CcmH